jgi:hypothetical protein
MSKVISDFAVENERREFLNWISKEKIEEIHNITRQKRLENTGSWIFDHGNYKKWASGEKTGPLWLVGPGMLSFCVAFHR